MESKELSAIIKHGESSKVQFKERMPHPDSFAHEYGNTNMFAETMEIFDAGIKDIDTRLFSEYFKKEFGMSFDEKGLTLEGALNAKKVMRNNHVTLAGLFFLDLSLSLFVPLLQLKPRCLPGTTSAEILTAASLKI